MSVAEHTDEVVEDTPELAEFRAKVRAFLEANAKRRREPSAAA